MSTKDQQFRDLVQAWSADLYRYAFWLCGDESVAEDLVQETFMRAWKAWGNLRDDRAAKAWLMTILRRENARRFERVRPQLVDFDEQPPPESGDPGPDDESDAGRLRHAIAQLDPDYREPLLMQAFLGMRCEDIGEELGISRGAVMTRLFRARKRLAKILDIDVIDSPEPLNRRKRNG